MLDLDVRKTHIRNLQPSIPYSLSKPDLKVEEKPGLNVRRGEWPPSAWDVGSSCVLLLFLKLVILVPSAHGKVNAFTSYLDLLSV